MSILSNIVLYKGSYSILIEKNVISLYDNLIKTIPHGLIEYKNKRDGNDKYHLTVITTHELKNIKNDDLEEFKRIIKLQ